MSGHVNASRGQELLDGSMGRASSREQGVSPAHTLAMGSPAQEPQPSSTRAPGEQEGSAIGAALQPHSGGLERKSKLLAVEHGCNGSSKLGSSTEKLQALLS